MGFTNEGHVEPEGKSVNCSWAEHVELEGDFDSVKVGFVGSLKRRKVNILKIR